MIPAFDQTTGQIPPGRYTCTLGEVEERLVAAEEFETSTTRRDLFVGLLKYLADWEEAAERLRFSSSLLRSFWIAGSFASRKLDPRDIDITPVVDGVLADEACGKPGSKRIRDLTQHRDGIKRLYGLEVFPLRWFPVVQPHRADAVLSGDQQAYLHDRGRLDDWWERCRIDGSDIPSVESCSSRRGYLEVRL
ncbi:hypothetical protein [Nocardia sp. CC227C]|uniref:DUF6932 family protein n=1 Tax=Nocardia sp. CC227C TaxID=3044562 RepID=UPI00278C1817|nr:hypothetical protein [Nocardia sp. CC227C]